MRADDRAIETLEAGDSRALGLRFFETEGEIVVIASVSRGTL
jgi:hypothetical protein